MHIRAIRGAGGQFRLLLGSFMMLGAMFGVWQVSIADLSNTLAISAGPLAWRLRLGR